jgi:nitroreductase
MHTYPSIDRVDTQAVTDALAEAAAVAGYAPSIHNTQPWHWKLATNTLDLYLDRGRVLHVTDSDARLATLSCGAALHHARTALAASGWATTVTRLPNAGRQDHLAQIQVDGPAPVDAAAVRGIKTIALRHTDRRPGSGPPVGADDLQDIVAAVEGQGSWLQLLNSDQMLDLATAADHAQRAEAADPAWQAELAYWTGGPRPSGAGIPDAAIPDESSQTTVPGRDFGHPGDLPISAAHDHAAVFAILHGASDEAPDWIRAGEALSAGWLTATERGVSVSPLSAPIEVIGTRDTLRRILAYLYHPYLVVRFGTVDPTVPDPPHAPRLPADQTIDRQ